MTHFFIIFPIFILTCATFMFFTIFNLFILTSQWTHRTTTWWKLNLIVRMGNEHTRKQQKPRNLQLKEEKSENLVDYISSLLEFYEAREKDFTLCNPQLYMTYIVTSFRCQLYIVLLFHFRLFLIRLLPFSTFSFCEMTIKNEKFVTSTIFIYARFSFAIYIFVISIFCVCLKSFNFIEMYINSWNISPRTGHEAHFIWEI